MKENKERNDRIIGFKTVPEVLPNILIHQCNTNEGY